MKKMLLGAVGLSAVLASCGSGVAPDGSGSGNVSALRTEYRLNSATGPFIACDNLNQAVATTQVSVYFSVAGSVQSVNVGLYGNTNSDNDANYNTTVSGQQLAAVDASGNYRLTFNASPATGGFLPQSIVVTPTRAKVKIVSADPQSAGSFYTKLAVDTGTANYSFSSRFIGNGNVAVYPNCSVIGITGEDV